MPLAGDWLIRLPDGKPTGRNQADMRRACAKGLVERPRLSERVSRGTQSKLTLISAPAGFGKTTLLAEWFAAADRGRNVAWLSLDQSDDELTAFWSHIVAALQKAIPTHTSLADLLPPGQKADDTFPAKLLNALADTPGDLDVVLDDFHVIGQRDIEAGLSVLFEHLPPQIHIVISTRADPALPLGRLRARGELVEDSIERSSFYLRRKPRPTSMARHDGTGSHRSKDIRRSRRANRGLDSGATIGCSFARGRREQRCSVHRRLCRQRPLHRRLSGRGGAAARAGRGSQLPLPYLLSRPAEWVALRCGRVTWHPRRQQAMLDALDRRENLFIVPLDDRRQWYRYHHLFADVLLAHLPRTTSADELPTLRRRAENGYERQGDRQEAIAQFLAGDDFQRAAAPDGARRP